MNIKHLPLALIFVTAALVAGCSDSDKDDNQVKDGTQMSVRLLETTDLHANLLNFNYFSDSADDKVGLVRTAALIRAARNEVANSVLVDNGDLIQGSPLGDYMAKIHKLNSGQVHPVYKAMNTLNYDVANIGNHEFNFGLPFLQEAINDANFPYISANVFKYDGDNNGANDEPLVKPYVILDKSFKDHDGKMHSLKVGFIGFVPPQIMQWDKANLEGKVIAKDIVEMAKLYVPKMKSEGADIVVAVPHSGLEIADGQAMAENASYDLSKVPGIDAIMFGHAHADFPGSRYANMTDKGVDIVKGTINGVAAVMPGFWGNNLGVIDLTLQYKDKQWQVVNSQSKLQPIYRMDENKQTVAVVENDAQVEAAVMKEHNATREWVNKPFAKITAPVYSYFALVNDDPSIQIVTDAQAWYTKKIVQGTELEGLPILSAGAPFRAGRGGSEDFTAIPVGDIAYRNVADLYIYPNVLKVLKLTGSEVKEWLEMSAGQYNKIDPEGKQTQALINPEFPSYNYDVLDGITYQIDVTQPARYNAKGEKVSDGQRIVNLRYNNQAIDLNAAFLVATNNYRASGGGNFPNINASKIVVDSPNENRQVVADYIEYQSSQNAGQGLDPSVDMNWKFAPVPNVEITFMSANNDKTVSYSAQFPHIFPTGQTNADGFAIYKLDLTQP
ncbi:MAG: bifunctional 2',3'-cyclic-nucleotide 2'-phosphodiesterase/3'-nucleotidase [Gammaproteobacteria bacterium]|nr:bifunctional 2',3'-cyclic-nucleotide 2'-phosphodiesterase/3'-nucleotidase [Gammaproteobacteria bacterium]